jgi:hypothetical protein
MSNENPFALNLCFCLFFLPLDKRFTHFRQRREKKYINFALTFAQGSGWEKSALVGKKDSRDRESESGIHMV